MEILVARRIHALRRFLLPRDPEYQPAPLRKAWLEIVYTIRRWIFEDRCAAMAAVLTLDTLLSLIPVLGIALVGVSFLDPEDGRALLHRVFETFMPDTDTARSSTSSVMRLAGNVTVQKLGAWGFLVALGIGFMLFASLERAFNNIWRARQRRNIVVKFTMYYTVATLGPLIVLYSLQQSLFRDVSEAAWAPFATMTLALVLLNRWFPNTHVRWGAALGGGAVASILFTVGQQLFAFYVQQVASETYEGLYGSLAVMPLFVVWSYLSWLVILLGAEVAFVIHHRRSIQLQGYVNPYLVDGQVRDAGAGRTAARLMLAVADNYDRRNHGITRHQLADRFRLQLGRVGEIMNQLYDAGYVLQAEGDEHGYVPSRPLDRIRVHDILCLYDGEESDKPREDELTEAFSHLDRTRREIVGETTYADLVARARTRHAADVDEGPSGSGSG